MPLFQHGKTSAILLNEYELTSFLNEMAPSGGVDMHDLTTFGNSDKVMGPGLGTGMIDLMGFFSTTLSPAVYADQVFAALEASAVVPILSAAPQGFAIGNRVYMLQAHEVKHELGIKVDQYTINKANFQGNDGFDFGVSLHNITPAETVSANGSSVDNLAATANGGVGFFHCIAASGSSPSITVKVQHSTDGSSWVDLVTFTSAVAITKERIVVVAGTQIRRFLRSTSTITGTTPSFNYNVSFGRRLP